MKNFKFIVIACSLATGSIGAVQAQTPTNQPMTRASADSTATQIHASDGSDHPNRGVTADTQKNNPTDLNLTRRIRRSVVADKSLSTAAHNVVIVTLDGTVTLKGAVRSRDEKQAVETKATKIAGQDRVVNDLTIAMANQ